MCEEHFTVAQVATVLHLHLMTVYRLVKTGKLAAVRIGNRIRIPQSAVDKFLSH